MEAYGLAVLTVFIIVYALVSKRLSTTFITGPMLFAAAGLLMGSEVLGMVEDRSTPNFSGCSLRRPWFWCCLPTQ